MSVRIIAEQLSQREIEVLLRLYYHGEDVVDTLDGSDEEKMLMQQMTEKKLVQTQMQPEGHVVSLTEQGLSVCGSIMAQKVQQTVPTFQERIKELPRRAVSCLVNRLLVREQPVSSERCVVGYPRLEEMDQLLWYEQVLLLDDRMQKVLNSFYQILDSLDLIKVRNAQWWCAPAVEEFLRAEFAETDDLSWVEEDSLKYYYFFHVYAQDQKHLIDFSGDGSHVRSQFFEEETLMGQWFIGMPSDPRMLLHSLEISERRIRRFLETMQKQGLVAERYYPMSSFASLQQQDQLFVIQNIKGYVDHISSLFLDPVVKNLLDVS